MFPRINPIIPVRRGGLFESPEWLYELKHDGFRALAYTGGDRCRLVSKHGNEMKRFADLSGLIGKGNEEGSKCGLDGEIVTLDGTGKPAFYLTKRDCRAVYYAFDILWLNGRGLRGLSLLDRKKILRSVIPRKSSCIGYVGHSDRGAMKLFELVKKSDLEGLVVKRKDGKYAQQTL